MMAADRRELEFTEDIDRVALAILPHLHGLPVRQVAAVLRRAQELVEWAAVFDRDCRWISEQRQELPEAAGDSVPLDEPSDCAGRASADCAPRAQGGGNKFDRAVHGARGPRLLAALTEMDARGRHVVTTSDLAAAVGLTGSEALAPLKRLEKCGVIWSTSDRVKGKQGAYQVRRWRLGSGENRLEASPRASTARPPGPQAEAAA